MSKYTSTRAGFKSPLDAEYLNRVFAVTNPIEPEPEPGKGARAFARADALTRVIIGGGEKVAIRRIILWVLVLVSFLAVPTGPALVGLTAAALLFATDKLL